LPLRPDMKFEDVLPIFSKRKLVIIISFLFVFFGAGVYTVVTPEQFKSTTTILVIPQQVPVNYVQSTVTQGVESRLTTIREQVTSRTMLTKVMEELGLFAMQRKVMLQEAVVEMMKDRIEIVDFQEKKALPTLPGTMAFSISFIHEDPKLAMLTASRLASSFIDEDLKSRERQAVGTSKLFDSELKETKAKLDAQEEKVKRYKMQHLGELPQELQTNLNTLARLQDQYRMNADSIRVADQTKLFLQMQLSVSDKSAQSIVHADGREEIDTSQSSAQSLVTELTSRRNQLAELSGKFTERHPDVIRLRKEVEQLEKKLAGMPTSLRSSNDDKTNVSSSKTYLPFTGREKEEFRRLKAQIVSTESEIVALKRDRDNIQRKIAAVQAKVDQAPRREQEMIGITHDYENLKKSYDDILKKKLEADISQELEVRQKGEQFQILDPANLPEKRFRPKRMNILAFALLLASALGFGGAIGLEAMDLSLRGVTDFKHFFDLPILACIPILENNEIDRRRKFRRKAALAGIVSFAFVLFTLLIFFGQKIRVILNN
jgi:polysaccharide chain length determinant protein (PEP-CTERM system associated)